MSGANNTTEKKLSELNRKLEIELQEKNKQVKKLASELIAAEQKERKRIARLLHNDLQQQLFSSLTKAKLLNDDIPDEFSGKVVEIIDQIGHSLQLTHQLVVSLSPPNIENNNLYKGINWLCKYVYNFHGLLVHTKEVQNIELENNDVLILILQMIQELLFNIVKHAGVDEARITTRQKDGMIHIHVIDQGKGFNENELDREEELDSVVHFGLSQTKEKLHLIGGRLLIDATPGKGTDVCLAVPCRQYVRAVD